MKILIVEDNPSDLEGLLRHVRWQQLGYEVAAVARDGAQGLAEALRARPEVLLSDIALPVFDGLTMARRIRAHLPELQVIFMSCHDDFRYAQQAIELSAHHYILKPIDLAELEEELRSIAQACRQRERERVHRRLFEENLPLIRQQTLAAVLYGRSPLNGRVRQLLGVPEGCGGFTILYLRLYPSGQELETSYSAMQTAAELAEQELLRATPGLLCDFTTEGFAIVCYGIPPRDTLQAAAQRLLERLREVLPVGASLGAGDPEQDPERLPLRYEQARQAAEMHFYVEDARLLWFDEVDGETAPGALPFQAWRTAVCRIMDRAEEGDPEALVDEVLQQNPHHEDYVKNASFLLVALLQSVLMERGMSYRDVFGEEMLIWQKLTRFDTILDVRRWLINVFEAVQAYMAPRDGQRYRAIVAAITERIDRDYARIERVADVVEPLYLSFRHANGIFKRLMGMTIFDYLVQRRMEAAKALLRQPTCLIYQVAEAVGYKSTIYFGTVFKQSVGLTPREYRDQYARLPEGGAEL